MHSYPKAIDGIRSEILFERKTYTTYCIGSIQNDKYVFADEQQKHVLLAALEYMDGTRSLCEIQEILLNSHGLSVDMDKLHEICVENDFVEKNFMENDIPATTTTTRKGFNELELFMVNLFNIKIGKFDAIFTFLSKHMHIIGIAALVISLSLIGVIFRTSPQYLGVSIRAVLSNPVTLAYYIIISFVSIILHEFAHVVAAYRYGLKPDALTVAIYAYVTPAIYVRLNGVYFIKPLKRIIIWSAGSLTNFFLALIFFALSTVTQGHIHLFFTVGTIINITLGAFSLIPLFISDGYYIMATILKAPNLRKSSFHHAKKFLRGNICKNSLIYVLYCFIFIGIMLYTLIIMLYNLIALIITEMGYGLSVADIAGNYVNILIFSSIGIIGKIVSLVIRRYKRGIDSPLSIKGSP